MAQFQSTLSSRRATACRNLPRRSVTHFNPRSPHGERRSLMLSSPGCGRFQSTLSSRRATPPQHRLPLRQAISIHALLTESDGIAISLLSAISRFQSTLSSRRATACPLVARSAFAKFQSTLSSRRATTSPPGPQRPRRNFNPRSPHGERLTPP